MVLATFGSPGVEMPSGAEALRITLNTEAMAFSPVTSFGIALM